jgi:tetratricopeptide (TPR) repeat protein
MSLPSVLPLVLVAALLPSPPARQDSPRIPLEELLERARARRAAERARLQPRVEAALERFAQESAPVRAASREALVDELVALGPAAGPLLVPHLDPGDDDPVARARAQCVAEALGRLQGPALTDPLLAVLADGSPAARRYALVALETSPEPERVRPALRAVFEGAPAGALKQAALRALIRIGGEGNAELYAEILSQPDAELVALALRALVDTRDSAAEPQVRRLVADPAQAQRHHALLLDYYRALPRQVDEELLGLWVTVVDKAGRLETRLAIVEALPQLGRDDQPALRRALEPLAETTDAKLREGVLVALTLLGDRTARRELLEGYDDFVDRNEDFPDAYVRRGQVRLRIEDWDDAIKDFQQALRLSRDDPRPQPDAYVGLARAYARRGKLRDAAEWLRKAPISLADLRELADDADFAELRASRYAKDAFGF